MTEVARSRENHRYSSLVSCLDHLGIANRTARLNDRGDSRFDSRLQAISEGEKGIGSQHCAARMFSGFGDSEACCIQATRQTTADAYCCARDCQDDRIRFHMLDGLPGELERYQFFSSGFAIRHRPDRKTIGVPHVGTLCE